MKVVFSYGKDNNIKSERQNINIRVYHSSFDFRRSTLLEISSGDWDVKKKELKLSGPKSPEHYRYLRTVKEKLDCISNAFEREFMELRLSHQLKSLNTNTWNEWCERTLNKGLNIVEVENAEVPFFLDKMNEYYELIQRDVKPSTSKGYKSNIGILKKFEKYKGKRYRTDEIDINWYNDLRDWNKDIRGNNDNYFGAIIRRVKSTINYFRSIDKNFPYHPNIDHKKFIAIKLSPDHDILNESEMECIFNYSGGGYLGNVRDLIIIQYHACLRYDELKSELSKGKVALDIYKDDNGNYFWKILEEKTGRISRIKKVIPVHKRILNLYTSANFPHIIELQVYNRYAKELINKLEIEKSVTSHTFRRSFATNMFNRGIGENDIMQYTGHTDAKTLRIYIKAKNVVRDNSIPTE